MQWLRSFVAQNPRRAIVLGKILFLAGSILILGALFARAGFAWIVPESPVVLGLAALLVLAGMALITLAEKPRR